MSSARLWFSRIVAALLAYPGRHVTPKGRLIRFTVCPLILLLLVLPAAGHAEPAGGTPDPPYLIEMPSVQRVQDEIRGDDERETTIRQIAAFHQLRNMITKLAGPREFSNQLTPDEQRLINGYRTAGAALANPLESSLTGQARSDWYGERGVLETSEDYRDELLERFFTPEWGNDYLEVAIGAGQALRRDIERQQGKGWASTSFQLLPSAKRRLQLELAVTLALVFVAVWRETRPFGGDPQDPEVVRAGFRRYRIHTATGRISGVRRTDYVTRKSTYDANGRWTGIHETTQTIMNFRLECSDTGGGSHAAESSASAPLYEGHPASLAWLIRRGHSTGSYFLLFNHQQGSWHTWGETLQGAFQPSWWPVLPYTWLAYTLPRFTSYGEAWPLLPGFLGFVVFVGYFSWRRRIRNRRMDAFYFATTVPLMARLQANARKVFPQMELAPDKGDPLP